LKGSYLISLLLLLSFFVSKAQYISQVLEYRPAPGQLINEVPWGTPSGAHSIEGDINGSLSLGAFGGYVIFRFATPVENDPQNPFGVDFTIFGNPMPDWSEPGVVWVMKDENENGKADDNWYELAGSDYWFSTTRKEYRVSYSNPGGDLAADVPWEDHLGGQGIIRANSVHTQSYYPLADSFPDIDPLGYTLEGTLLQGLVYEHASGMRSVQRAFGYADNQMRGTGPHTTPDNPYTREIEHAGGDGFDIGWAVDREGVHKELDRIHFIKVQSSILADGGWLGELSSELCGAVDVSPDVSLSGETEMVVIADLPPVLETGAYQLEVLVFQMGYPVNNRSVLWTTSHAGATVNEAGLLSVSEEGPLTLTAMLADRPEIHATVSTTVQLTRTSLFDHLNYKSQLLLYPNPTSDYFRLKGGRNSTLFLYDASGRELIRADRYREEMALDISAYSPGIYLVKIEQGSETAWLKLIKP
jgi:hypothetical protein